MGKIKYFFIQLTIDEWIFSLSGLGAIVFSIVGLFGFWPFEQKQTIQILLGAIGALMLAVVNLMSKRRSEIIDLKNTLGVCQTYLVDTGIKYNRCLIDDVEQAKQFVLDTFVNWEKPRPTAIYYISSEYQRKLSKKVLEKKLGFRQVQVIYHSQGLEEVIHKLLLHEGSHYLIRHYDPPPEAIPMIHLLSFDDESFYLGVGYPKGTPVNNKILHIRDEPDIAQQLKKYWEVLWHDAKPLNESGLIDWKELKRISARLGIKEIEFEELVEKIKNKVQSDKRRLKIK